MKLLSLDEIIAFVSASRLDAQTLELTKKVNGHIRSCDICLKLVQAFQLLYDEFCAGNASGDFTQYITAVLAEHNVPIPNSAVGGKKTPGLDADM